MLTRKRLAAVAAALALGAAAAWALRPRPIVAELAQARRGPLRVTVEGSGKTRVRDRYVVSAPAPGHLGRLAVTAGDAVLAGAVVARISAATPLPLDARTRAERAARLAAARAADAQARAALERARDAAALATAERARARALAQGGSLATRDEEQTELLAEERAHELEMATSAARQARAEVASAAAALSPGEGPDGRASVEVRAPAAGVVLRVLQESEAPVAAGTPLVELGDPSRLEVRVELLSTDAVRVRPGAEVEVTQWGGERALRGRVRRVEPSAFTKISALGVEEQRVNVLVDPVGEGWSALGDGFSVEAAIVVSDRDDVPQVPAAALFRRDAGWSTFVAEGGRARLRAVHTGAASRDAVEIVDGLVPGQLVVVRPSDALSDGARLERAVAR